MAEQTLGQMVVKLDLDSSAFGSGLAGAKKAATSAMAEMKASMKVAAATGDKIATLATQQQGLMKEIQAQAKIMNSAQKEYSNSFDKTTGQATKSTAMYAKAYNDAVGKMAQFQSQAVKAAGQQAVLQTKTRGVTGAINTMGTKMTSASKTLSSFGSKATWGVTVPIIAAFAAAGKQALQFQNQLNTIKNLLITSGESGTSAMKAVSQMQSQAVTLSDKYGVSVTKISQGYEDLVRRGYTGAQAVASMKTELQGALASGDDFNDVVKVASETIEAFGMRSKNTTTQTKNTKTAVNELAYAADATATDFADLGLGMSYVGSSAHQAGFSLSETSAAMGILSNNGLSAQKAGTGLRKVVISLTTAVGKIDSKNSVLAKLGIKKAEMVDANGNLKNMSTIMGVLAKHTQGMSKTEKATVFNSLFGTTGQQAGIILTQNASALAKLNKQVEASVGKNYVGELSQKNLASAQNQLKIFMETAKNLGMVLAEDVLPTITPLMGDAADLADKFAHLDPNVRKATVAFIAAVAAVGPLSSGLGIVTGMLGKTSTGLVSAIANVRKWSAETTAAGEATQAADGILGLFGGRVAKTAENTKIADATVSDLAKALSGAAPVAGEAAAGLTETGTAAGAMGTGMTASIESGVALTGTLSALGIALGVAGVAVAGGVAWWELWGKKIHESQVRTDTWGSDIGSTADKAATKFNGFEQDVTGSLNNTTSSAKQNASDISGAFKKMLDSATSNTAKAKKQLDDLASEFGGKMGTEISEAAKESESKRNAAVADMVDYYHQIQAITKSGNKLTSDQTVEVRNLQIAMATSWVKTLNVSAKQQQQVLRTMEGDFKGMSGTQLTKYNGTLTTALGKAKKTQDKYLADLKAQYDKGNIDYQTYTKVKKQSQDQYEQQNASAMEAEVRTALQAYKKSSNYQQLGASEKKTTYAAMIASQKKYLTDVLGLTDDEAAAIMKTATSTKQASDSTLVSLNGLKGKAAEAASNWNDLVFDTKTGKVKTNAQEEVNKAVNSEAGWNQIELLLKEGKMTSNAKEMVANALIANNEWDTSNWKLAELIAVNKTGSAVIDAMANVGTWQKLSPKQQKLVAQAKTKSALVSALKDIGAYNSLPAKVKKLLANADDVKNKSKQSQDAVQKHNSKSVAIKKFTGNATNVVNASGTGQATLNKYNGNNPHKKTLKAQFSNPGYTNTVSAINWFGGKKNSVKKFTSIFTSIYNTITAKKKATGDMNFSGGLAMVNDQKGSTFREAISDPVLGDFIPSGRNVVLPLSRHAKVYRAALTKQMYPGLPQFANGLNVPASATPLQMAREVSHQTTINNNTPAITFDTTALVANQQLQIATMQQQNGLLSQMVQLLASSGGSPTGDAVRQLMQQMNTTSNQIGRGKLT